MDLENLQDPIRNYFYKLAIRDIPKDAKTILDIGSRDSGFPAYLATFNYNVLAIDRQDFMDKQNKWKEHFKNSFKYEVKDVLDINGNFDVVFSIFALQHNINDDIKCYEKCAKLFTKKFIIASEYNNKKDKFHIGRDDGDLRIYSENSIMDRIMYPIEKIKKIQYFKKYYRFNFEKQTVIEEIPQNANCIYINIGKYE